MNSFKILIAVSTLFFAGACSDQAMREKHLNVESKFALAGNAGELLPLEPRLMNEQIIDDERSTTRTHITAFGNWLASCNYSKQSGRKFAVCGIVPWNGQMVSDMAVPLSSGPQINLRTGPDATATIRGPGQYGDKPWSFECGSLKIKSKDGQRALALRTSQEAAPLIQRLKSGDCAIAYTNKAGEPDTIAFIGHGFREAHDYAKRYVANPK